MPKTPLVEIYSKPGCCLCERAKEILTKVQSERFFILKEVDITNNPMLFEKYQYSIPVVCINGKEVLISKVSELWFNRILDEVWVQG